jgi:predicted enzyme related to lactoylglutathione lyase
MFLGLRTVIYHVDDIDAAKQWYTTALGMQPYFDQPFYVGFTVGGYELGLDPDNTGITPGNNHVAYWGVEEIEEAYGHLLACGATRHSDIQDVGEGLRIASVCDPFGNTLGIIENPYFKLA